MVWASSLSVLLALPLVGLGVRSLRLYFAADPRHDDTETWLKLYLGFYLTVLFILDFRGQFS